jgi:hypothetical protein
MDEDDQYFEVEEVEDDLNQEEFKRVFKIDDEEIFDEDGLKSPTDIQV